MNVLFLAVLAIRGDPSHTCSAYLDHCIIPALFCTLSQSVSELGSLEELDVEGVFHSLHSESSILHAPAHNLPSDLISGDLCSMLLFQS